MVCAIRDSSRIEAYCGKSIHWENALGEGFTNAATRPRIRIGLPGAADQLSHHLPECLVR